MSGKKPHYRVRIGSVIASVWKNETESRRIFHTVNLQRTFKEGDETRYSDSFSLGDLANLQRVITKVQAYVEEEESVVTE